jgi:hypothetical protein
MSDISLDLFDLAASAKPAGEPANTPNTEPTKVEATEPVRPDTESNTENAETQNAETNQNGDTEAPTSKYGLVVAQLPEGEQPADTMTAREFAALLTVKRVRSAPADADPTTLVVPESAIYAAMRAARHPLPVVLVADKAYLPVAQAIKAWEDRPVRGEGAAATSKRSDADLLKTAASARRSMQALQARLENLTERADKAVSLVDKYTAWLGDRDLDWAAVDAWEAENPQNTSSNGNGTETNGNGSTVVQTENATNTEQNQATDVQTSTAPAHA